MLAAFSPALAPDGRSVAFIGLDERGTRDVYVLDLESADLRRLTFDDRAERELTWGPRGIVFSSDATEHGYFNLFSLPDPADFGVERLTNEPIDHGAPLVLDDGRVFFTAYHHGAADLYEAREGHVVRRTNVSTGLALPAPGPHDGVWALMFHSGRRRLVHVGAGDLLKVEARAAATTGGSPAEPPSLRLDEAVAYSPFELRNWTLTNIFALLGAGFGGVYGYAVASASDTLRDHTLYLELGISGDLDLTNGIVRYVNQERRVAWGGGFFQEIRLRTRTDDTTFAERFFGGEVLARYPLSRFANVQGGLLVGGAGGVALDDLDLAAPEDTSLAFQTELDLSIGYDTIRYSYLTGPLTGHALLVEAAGGIRPTRNEVYVLLRADAEKYFQLWGHSNFLLRGSAGASAGNEGARPFLLSSWYTLRGVDLDHLELLLGYDYVTATAELQVPLRALIDTPLFSSIEGIAAVDMGAVADDPSALWDRRVLDFATGFNFGFGPLVLRLHFAWPFRIGGPTTTTSAPVVNVSLGWFYF